jgi:hypothetical protein
VITLLLLLLAQNTAPADVQSVYMAGWEAARQAARVGGSPESLAPVHLAIARLERMAEGTH